MKFLIAQNNHNEVNREQCFELMLTLIIDILSVIDVKNIRSDTFQKILILFDLMRFIKAMKIQRNQKKI